MGEHFLIIRLNFYPKCTESPVYWITVIQLHHCTVTRITIKRIRWSLILPILENFMNVHDSCYRNDDRCNHWWAFSTRSIAKIVSASGYFHFNSLLISHYRNQIRLLLLWDWTYVKTHSENVTQVHSFIIENQNNTPVHSGFDGHVTLWNERDFQAKLIYLNEYIQNRKDEGIDAW